MKTRRLKLKLSNKEVFCEYITVKNTSYSIVTTYHLYFQNPFSYTEDDIEEIVSTFEHSMIERFGMYLNDYKHIRLKDQLLITIEAIKHSNQLEEYD
jgi:hypothetical protein